MIPLFVGLTAANLFALIFAGVVGYGVSSGKNWSAWHQLTGAIAAITCCAVHCVVFTYFMATAKWIQHAVSVTKLDPRLVVPTRSFKAQALPGALLAMAVVFATAVAGVAIFSYRIDPIWHHGLAIASLVVNVVVACLEYRAIQRNGELIDQILLTISRSTHV
jgi:hypothetical protein